MALTGVIIERYGWSAVFYIYGVAGLVWYSFWLLFVSDSPSTNRFISKAEKKYLLENVANVNKERKVLYSSAPSTGELKTLIHKLSYETILSIESSLDSVGQNVDLVSRVGSYCRANWP